MHSTCFLFLRAPAHNAAAICGTGLNRISAPCPKFTAMLANPPISVANPPRNAPKIRPVMSDIIVPALIALD